MLIQFLGGTGSASIFLRDNISSVNVNLNDGNLLSSLIVESWGE